ncbi:hypothetical protein W911_07245 [Hyphomicrobium nitrativorans NL23]|uniref:Uncharacterized protein n=1 Tax=Hyphomicrobium nitrativorans NL23 TaxID=1029756 RepID=V5SCK2_9HYPH|nr:hypothetical protein [Hyphomicrobium nitrativorans]AHB48217.1 hypothetical protein W911_07245 [Hyphomicrobium nitrativorans NL23]
MDKLIAILKSELERWNSGWSVGSFGAIGEFHQDNGEALDVSDTENLTRATARGAIRIVPHPDMQAVAYELLSPRARRWSQGMALCLPEDAALGAQRNVLTELGPDTDAIRPADRDGILFDIGLEQPQIDFCIRTSDPELLAVLRRNVGKTTFACEAGHAILHTHPHRVVLSKLGRAEVFQKIGGPDTGGKSPEGPHTHVLPKLLAARRTHSANTPIAEGLTPCAFLHPANPVIAPLGDDKPFDPADFARFQSYLGLYGPAAYVATKKAVWAAVEDGQDPGGMPEPGTRLERVALRNALRQMERQGEAMRNELLLKRVAAWRAAFDKLEDTDESETA